MKEVQKENTKFFKLNSIASPAQIITAGFAIVILIGALLLNLPIASESRESIGFLDALFTATTSVCVTGLIVVDTLTHWSTFGEIVILILIQIGGLGFMTTATIFMLFARKKITFSERLVLQESLNQFDLSGLIVLTKRIIKFTFIVELIGAILLSITFIPQFGLVNGLYKSIFHAISAFCNAGIDLMGDFKSLSAYQSNYLVNYTIMFLIIFGGIGFNVVADFFKKRSFRRLETHSKLVIVMTILLISIGALIILVVEDASGITMEGLNVAEKITAALFQSVAARTAGFATLDLANLRVVSIITLILLMFVGGSPASTAGGIKTTTFGIVVKTMMAVIKGKQEVILFQRSIPKNIIYRAFALFIVAMLLIVGGSAVMSFTENFTFISLLFEATSAFGTVGLSLGITPGLTDVGKTIIIITMFCGRVGPLTILAAILARKRKKTNIKYPEDKVMIG